MTAPDNLLIRDLTRADRTAWQELWKAYLDFYQTALPPKMYDLAFDRLLSEDSNEFRGMLALVNEKPVGLVHFLSHRHGWYEEKVIYLQDLYVSPDVRGLGVGGALIREVYKIADQESTPDVYWLTATDNQPARRLYDSMSKNTGFIKYARADK